MLIRLLPIPVALTLLLPVSASRAVSVDPATPPDAEFTLTVVVTGATQNGGRLGVALFNAADGFPEERQRAVQKLERPRTAAVDSVAFRGLAAGRYAVAAYHDANDNGRMDKNMFGVPKEAWGTTGTVRPRTRAPRFDEAAVEVSGDTRVEIEVKR